MRTVDRVVDERGHAGFPILTQQLGLGEGEAVRAVAAEQAKVSAELPRLAAAGSPGDAEARGDSVVLERQAGVEVAEAGGQA